MAKKKIPRTPEVKKIRGIAAQQAKAGRKMGAKREAVRAYLDRMRAFESIAALREAKGTSDRRAHFRDETARRIKGMRKHGVLKFQEIELEREVADLRSRDFSEKSIGAHIEKKRKGIAIIEAKVKELGEEGFLKQFIEQARKTDAALEKVETGERKAKEHYAKGGKPMKFGKKKEKGKEPEKGN